MRRSVGLRGVITLLFLASTGRAEPSVPAKGPPPPQPPSAPPTPFPALGAVQPAGPFVYLRADNPRTTLQVQLDPELWGDVCIVPCARPLDPSHTYRVTGHRFVPTDPFTLPRSSGQVTIDAKMGKRVENIFGKVMVPVGAGLTVAGAALFFFGSRKMTSQTALEANQGHLSLHTYGVFCMVGGLGVSLIGFLLWYRNSSTVEMN